MNNISNANNLSDKIMANRYLLKKLHDKYGCEILFTGGTSLMERDIINRYSEDIDIITTVSRKKILKFINNDDNYSATPIKNSSMVTEYKCECNIEHIGKSIITKLDIVSLEKAYSNKTLKELSSGSTASIKTPVLKLPCKEVEQILYDKICAIVEEVSEIKSFMKSIEKTDKITHIKSRGHSSKRTKINNNNESNNYIRVFRHYYDVTKIIKNKIIIDKKKLSQEMKRRSKKENYLKGIKEIDNIYIFLNNDIYLLAAYEVLEKQFIESEVLKSEDIRYTINKTIDTFIEILET